MADRDDAVWNTLRGNWNQLKGKVREKWGLLTNDDIEHIGGHKDRLVGTIQERYGKTKWEAPSDIPRFSGVLSTAGDVVFSGQLTGEFEAFEMFA